jgi:signal transduction histidine kinase
MGLAIARRLVEAHGGTVSLQSTPGAGTCVTVRLPHALDGGGVR